MRFLLVINTNLSPILHRYQVTLIKCQIFASDSLQEVVLLQRPRWGWFPAYIALSDIPLKLDFLGYISLTECIGVSSTTFT